MPSTVEVALVSVPMAVYLYALGLFHGGKHPRVVSGTADLLWLMLGLGGLVAFGPLGRVVVSALFGPDATAIAWSLWVAGLVLVAVLVARTGRNRLVVYHVEPDPVRSTTRDALADSSGSFAETLQGFEDRASRTSVNLRLSHRTKTAVIDVQGDESGRLIAQIRPRIGDILQTVDRPVSTLSTAFFAASSLVMLIPVVGFVTVDPQGRRAVRMLGKWLKWW